MAAGRPSVPLVLVEGWTWRIFAEVADVFRGPADPDWTRDRDRIDHEFRDPWATE